MYYLRLKFNINYMPTFCFYSAPAALRRYMFWLPLPFLVSEREPHCDLERAVQFNAAMRKVLQPRGWIEVSILFLTVS